MLSTQISTSSSQIGSFPQGGKGKNRAALKPPPTLGVSPHHDPHRTSEDDGLGCTITETKRKVFRFHETILSFGEPGSLGNVVHWIFFPLVCLASSIWWFSTHFLWVQVSLGLHHRSLHHHSHCHCHMPFLHAPWKPNGEEKNNGEKTMNEDEDDASWCHYEVTMLLLWCYHIPSLKLTDRSWKWMVGRLLSFWDGNFSGAMSVSGRLTIFTGWLLFRTGFFHNGPSRTPLYHTNNPFVLLLNCLLSQHGLKPKPHEKQLRIQKETAMWLRCAIIESYFQPPKREGVVPCTWITQRNGTFLL